MEQLSRQARGKSNGGGGLPSDALRRRLTHIPAKQALLLRLPNDKLKAVTLHPGKLVSLGKFGSFRADDIIGLPFGLTFEIGPGPVGALRVVVSSNLDELEETSATNENIDDGANAQALTYLDIQALKEAGMEGKDIVQKQKEGSTSFAQRTAWSQQKYTLKKEAKHLRLFTPIPSTLTTLAKYNFEKDSEKVRGLRFDALAHTLSFAGIAPGGRYLVVDGVGGLLAGAMLERMGGEGRLLALNDADSPPAFDLLSHFNLPSQVVDPVLRSLHWASIDEGWSPAHGTPTTSSRIPQTAMSEPITTPTGRPATDRDRQRMRKRQAALNGLLKLRGDFLRGEWDALVICCGYEPTSIVERLLPKLAGSANIVIHSPFVQPLIEAHARLRLLPNLINVSVSEPWLRKYQVLPGRMHPEMMTSSTGGAILHAVRVYTEDEAKDQRRSSLSNQETAAEDGRKRRRVDVIA